MEGQERLVKKIKSLSDSIRKKNRALRSNISEREALLESTFKPITNPLKQIGDALTRADTERNAILPVSSKTEYSEDVKEEENDVKEEENDVKEEENDVDELLEPKGNESSKEEEEEESEEEMSVGEMSEGGYTSTFEDVETDVLPASRLSEMGQELSSKGPLTRKYILKMLHSAQPKRNYHSYGARLDDGGLMIGDKKVTTDDTDSIIIGDNQFSGTKGLFELLFTKKPRSYTQRDLLTFKHILLLTNAHKKNYSSGSPLHRNTSTIYTKVVSKIFPKKLHKTSSGKGMKNVFHTNVIYYNDVNKLVDRLRLLYEAQTAGHTGVGNEIISLTDELRGRGYIL